MARRASPLREAVGRAPVRGSSILVQPALTALTLATAVASGAALLSSCSDPSLDAILAAGAAVLPTCSDGARNGSETDVDCGGATCTRTCDPGKSCASDDDCSTAVCVDGRCWIGRTCAEVHAKRPSSTRASNLIDPSPTGGAPPFEALCDMTTAGGGWTRVAFEPRGAGANTTEGSLAYLGRDDLSPPDAVDSNVPGLVGTRFAGLYGEVTIRWGTNEYVRFSAAREIFTNEVDPQIPLTNFSTSDDRLNEWVLTGGGAMFCRASKYPSVRPGDTSWAVKPVNSTGAGCGCNDVIWHDRGLFYGGGIPITSCTLPRGGAFSGVKDGVAPGDTSAHVNEPKAGEASTSPLSIWVR
jgi:hypothetical protein